VRESVRLVFLGDLMLGRGVSRKLRDLPPEWFWGDVLPILRQADGVIANLEGPITRSDARWRQGWKMFHFRADPAAVRILECGNVGFVCLANNHMLDFSEPGLLDTIQTLDLAGIRHAGAGRNAAEAAAPTILELPGLKVGLFAATDNMRAFGAGPDRPGTNFMAMTDAPDMLGWIDRSVRAVRQAGADLVVLSLHWGPNMRLSPSRSFRRLAHAAIERGVDVIHGHSAHVVQAVERYRRGIVLYDTGNVIDDYWKFPFRATVTSFVFLLDIEGGRPARLRMVPVHVHSAPLGLARGKTFEAITGRMASLCAAFGTPIVDTPEGLEIPLS
jgi:poly-gamma-glutamate capsule biosynthesis protein CapA/YwtB (metallophosphatase superfamily)